MLFFQTLSSPFHGASPFFSWIQVLLALFTIIAAVPVTLTGKNQRLSKVVRIQTLLPLFVGVIAVLFFISLSRSALLHSPAYYREETAIECMMILFSPIVLGIVLSSLSAAVVIPLTLIPLRAEERKIPAGSLTTHALLLTSIPFFLNVSEIYMVRLENSTPLPAKYESLARTIYPYAFPDENQRRRNHKFDIHLVLDKESMWLPAEGGFLSRTPLSEEPIRSVLNELDTISRISENMVRTGLLHQFPDKNCFLLEIETEITGDELQQLTAGVHSIDIDTIELRINKGSYRFLSRKSACDSILLVINEEK